MSIGTTEYTYHYNNLLESVTTPDDKTIYYEYDKYGKVTEVTDYAGDEYTYVYNTLGELTEIKKDSSTIASYTYDGSGVLTKVTYPYGTSEYAYDNAMRLISLVNKETDGTLVSEYLYTYDLVGNRTKEIITDDNYTDYTYDDAYRLTYAVQYKYFGDDYYIDWAHNTYAYDVNDNMTSKGFYGNEYYGYGYTFDDVDYWSYLMGITTTYTYNNLNQLISSTETTTASHYDNYGYDYTKTDVKNYSYDIRGNMTGTTSAVSHSLSVDYETPSVITDTPQTQVFTYNPWNQLIAYTVDGTTTTYEYDGTGMRVSKAQGDDVRKYYWDRGCVVNEYIGNAHDATNYIGLNGIFAREEDNSATYMLKNGHGDVVYLLTQTRTTQEYDYDPYGNPSYYYDYSATDTNPVRYSGEYYDLESGLIYLRNRYYDPNTGRFISEDPIQDGMNWYVYCGGNPIVFVDPEGLAEVLFYETISKLGGSAYYSASLDTMFITGLSMDYILGNFSSMSPYVAVNGTIVGNTTVGFVAGYTTISTGFFENFCNMYGVNHYAGDDFVSPFAAAVAWGLRYDTVSIVPNKEYASAIYRKPNGMYSFTVPNIGDELGVTIPDVDAELGIRVSAVHTHGSYMPGYKNEDFSDADMKTAKNIKGSLYLITQKGYIKRYNYKTGKTTVLGSGFYIDPKLFGPEA